MRNNPIVPFILIMVFGIGLIFFLSLDGVGKKEEIANGDNAAAEEQDSDGAALVQTCAGCHGGDLTGGVGPDLTGFDAAHIEDVLVNGLEGSTFMTPGMKNEAEAKAIAEYITSLK